MGFKENISAIVQEQLAKEEEIRKAKEERMAPLVAARRAWEEVASGRINGVMRDIANYLNSQKLYAALEIEPDRQGGTKSLKILVRRDASGFGRMGSLTIAPLETFTSATVTYMTASGGMSSKPYELELNLITQSYLEDKVQELVEFVVSGR